MLIVFSVQRILLNIAQEWLTRKQKLILQRLLNNHQPATPVVHLLANELNCSVSAVWRSLSQLKRLELVEYGSYETKGEMLKLTAVGTLLMEMMKND